jgi:hypothetical protein
MSVWLLGLLFGVLAGVPAALLVLAVNCRRPDDNVEGGDR